MQIMLNGVTWTLQVVNHQIAHGFEVSHTARLIRVEFTPESWDFAARTAQAVAGALAVPVYSVVD